MAADSTGPRAGDPSILRCAATLTGETVPGRAAFDGRRLAGTAPAGRRALSGGLEQADEAARPGALGWGATNRHPRATTAPVDALTSRSSRSRQHTSSGTRKRRFPQAMPTLGGPWTAATVGAGLVADGAAAGPGWGVVGCGGAVGPGILSSGGGVGEEQAVMTTAVIRAVARPPHILEFLDGGTIERAHGRERPLSVTW